MKRNVLIGGLVAATVAVAGFAVYVYLNDPANHTFDPLALPRAECGGGDASKGDKPEACITLSYMLMGQENVKIDDDAARAILKRACDHAHQRSCDVLAAFETNKLFVLEGRCTGSWGPADPASCLDAGQRHADGRGGSRPDPAAARTWFDKGCALGLAAACEARDQIR